ncbi:unnamed protein product [Phytomonas sp. EM1]|nr:unnamed protein product [Phytomonas sp. EM1]|eukprot:CCW60988.1 unnamed protein product [Phytomonas sp. isolate EM1]
MTFQGPFNLQVARTPYQVVGTQAFRPSAAPPSCPNNLKKFAVGVVGLRELASRQVHSPVPNSTASSSGLSAFLCCQRKGQLLVCAWETLQVIGNCIHGVHTAVTQCIVTESILITRVECESSEDTLESDHNVYVWDVKTFAPLYELHGHSARITSMAVHPSHPSLVATAALDYMVCVWDLLPKTANCLWDGETRGLGNIAHLEWLPNRKTERQLGVSAGLLIAATDVPLSVWRWDGETLTQIAATPINRSSGVTAVYVRATPHASQCVVHTGSTDGYVRRWVIDGNPADETCSIEIIYQTKLHHASINHLLANERINISGSLYSGAALYHCQKGTKAKFEEIGGVSSMFLDDANKLVLVGAVNGFLWVIGYAGFELADAKAKTSETTTLYRFCMCKTAINGIVLELGNDNTWRQLLTVSSNGYITALDYKLRHVQTVSVGRAAVRDSSSDPLPPVMAVPFLIESAKSGGTLLIANVKNNTISIIDHSKPNSSEYGSIMLPKNSVVTCIHWDATVEKMFIGVQRESVRAFCLDSADFKSGIWIQMNLWKLKSYFPISFSKVVDNIIVVCLSDNPSSIAKARGWLGILVSTDSERDSDGLVELKPLDDFIPFSATLLESSAAQTGKESAEWSAAVVVQSTKGLIQVFSVEMADDSTGYRVIPKMVLSPPAPLGFSKTLKSVKVRDPFSCKPFYAASYETPSSKDVINITWVEDLVLFCTRVYTSLGFKSTPLEPIKLPNMPNHPAPSIIREVHWIDSHEVSIVVLYQGSSYALLGSKQGSENDTSMLALSCTGEVLQYDGEKWKTKETGIMIDEAESNKKACVCVSSYSEKRYIAFGYSNGLVQLLDASGIYVFARLWMGATPLRDLRGVWCFEKYVIVQDDSGAIYSAPLHNRYLFDSFV